MNNAGTRVGLLRSILSTMATVAAFSFLWLLGGAVIRTAAVSMQQVGTRSSGEPHADSPLIVGSAALHYEGASRWFEQLVAA